MLEYMQNRIKILLCFKATLKTFFTAFVMHYWSKAYEKSLPKVWLTIIKAKQRRLFETISLTFGGLVYL